VTGGTVTSNGTFNNSTATSTLTVNGGGSYAIAGAVTNSGTITAGGATAGSLTANAGITNNSGATISVNANGTVTDTLTNAGTVTNNGIYNADVTNTGSVTNNLTWNGNLLSNTGLVTNSSGATWTGSGSNSAGGTLINAGTWTGAITNAGTFNNNAGGTVSAGLTNSGNATNAGAINGGAGNSGTLGNSGTINGGLSNTAGTTTNSGTINNGVTVSGGTLAGTGTVVGGVTVNSGGTLAPGAPGTPGTMTIANNLVFNSGAFYLVQVNPSNASSSNVTSSGTAALAGTVEAAFAAGSYVSRTYTILHAAGRSGTFSGLMASNLPIGFTERLSYTSTDAVLNLTATLGAGAIGTGGLSGNQQNVANGLNSFFNNGGALPPSFVTLFGLTGGNLAHALTQLSGEAATGTQQSAFELMSQFLGILTDPFLERRGGTGGASNFAAEDEPLPPELASAYAAVFKAPVLKVASFEQRWSLWGSAYGGANRTNGDPNGTGSQNLSARAGGFAAGADYQVSPFTLLGFALAGGGTNWSLAQGLGGGRSDAFQAGVYGKTASGPAYVAASLAYAEHWMSTDRVAFASDHLTANFNARSYGGRIETGYRLASPFVAVTPYAAIQAQAFATPAFSENDPSSGGLGLTFAARTATDTRGEIGARFDHAMALDPTSLLMLRAKLGYAHDWVSDPSLAAVFQALPGASFIVNGATPAHDSGLASAAAELRFANGLALGAKFDGEFAARSETYAGTATVRYTW
jgi:uncharacterized protein with beta-barrel porin domain